MPLRLADALVAAVPGRCAVCGAWPAAALCAGCIAQLARPQERCLRCALPLPGGGTCGACLRAPPPLDACHAALPYDWPWAGLIARFKFHGEPAWAGQLARLLRASPGVAEALEQADWLLPLPLAHQRLAERGFNQALELARRLAPQRTDGSLLLRQRDTPPQRALDRRQRLANLRGAFALAPGAAARVQGRALLLVDDVMTSGASLHAAAGVLRAAGARRVAALVLCRTPPPD